MTLVAGATSDIDLKLVPRAEEPAPAPPAPAPVAKVEAAPQPSAVPLRTWAYVAGGVGGAGLVTFAIFGAMTSSKYSTLESSCPTRHSCNQDDIDAGKRFQTIANVGLVVGIVGVGVGTTLFFLSSGQKHEAASALRVRLGVGSAALSGRF